MLRNKSLIALFIGSFLIINSASAEVTLGPITPLSPAATDGFLQNDVVYAVTNSPLTTPSVPSSAIANLLDLDKAIMVDRRGHARVIFKRSTTLTFKDIDFAGKPLTGFTAAPPTLARYEIKITTGTEIQSPAIKTNILKIGDGPGTDSNVTIVINGDGNKKVTLGTYSGERNGYQAGKDLFESGQTDTLVADNQEDVGLMKGVTVSRDNTNAKSSDWQIDKIVITKTTIPGGVATTMTARAGGDWLLDTNGVSYPVAP